jgi:hypothetical protein
MSLRSTTDISRLYVVALSVFMWHMKWIPGFSRSALTIALLFFLVLPCSVGKSIAGEPSPVQQDAAGKRAWELLGTYYRANRVEWDPGLDSVVDDTLRDLDGADTAKACEAASLLRALFRQSIADETNGRAEWHNTPFWGGGSESRARNFRISLAERFAKTVATAAAVPVADCLLREDPHAKSQAAAISIIGRCTQPAGDQTILGLLEHGCHSRPAIVMALEQAGKRRLKDNPQWIAKWSQDPRQSIRSAAAAALVAIGQAAPESFHPESAFDEQTRKLLTDTLSLPADPPDASARLGRFDITRENDGKKQTQSLTGWLRAEKDGVMQVTTWHGVSMKLRDNDAEKVTVRFHPMEAGELVALIRALRESKAKNTDDREKLMKLLSEKGGLTGQFEPSMLSAPEGLLAAWLFLKGDKATAATLLFPQLDVLDDDRWAFDILRDLVAAKCHQQMLVEFSYSRDYAETARLANHLAQPLFE